MDGRPHNVIRLVPAPQRTSKDPPPEYLRPFPVEENNQDSSKSTQGKPNKPANTIVIITTPPEFQKSQNAKTASIDGLQHHLISRGSLINVDSPEETGAAAEESFGEKYVDVVDTEVVKKEESEHTQSYTYLSLHIKRLYMIFTIVMLLDASFSALAMYAFDHLDKSYSHQALARIFSNRNTYYSNVVIFMFVLASFPMVGVATIAYPKPRFKALLYGRWGYFIFLVAYLVICMLTYATNIHGFYDIMRKDMKKDLDRAADLHLVGDPNSQTINVLRDFTQGYYGCCGVDGYKDWTPKRRNNLVDRGGYPVGCCDTSDPGSCFPPLHENVTVKEGKTTRTKQLILTDGCLQFEVRWTYGLSITFMLIICLVIIIAVVTPLYLYKLVAVANKFDIDLVDLALK